MKMKKSISILLSGMLLSGMLVGCSSEFDSTEYLDENGKELIEKYEDREKYNYIKVESLDYMSESLYKDKYIMITGKVTDIEESGQFCYEISFDFEENHTVNFIRVFINKNMIDVKFNKGDTITVYGRCNGIQTKRYDDKSFDYWHINAYFLELGDTTNKEKSTKKDDVEAKATEEKEVETAKDKSEEKETAKDKKEEKSSSQDNNKSNEKQIDTKKDNDNSTKEKPKKKDTNTKKDTKEEHRGYYVTCPNGHKIYTENGDWDCIECDDDWQEQQEADDTEEYEDGYIKDGTHLGENNPDESIEVIEDPEYYE